MSSPRKELGVAVVGLGVGEQHARTYLSTGICELRWLYDLDFQKSQHLSDELGAGAAAGDLEEILGDPRVQVVSVASYDDAHFEQVLAALEAGKHVFVEKPLCRTLDELRSIKRAWSKHEGRIKLSSNLVLRSAPIFRWLKERMDAGELGDIYGFDGDYLYGRLDKITCGWRKNVPDYSVMLGGGVHLVDLMLWLSHEKPASVYASGNRISTEHTEFHYDDYVVGAFRYPSGLIGRVSANFGSVHRHQHVVRVFGTEATFISDDVGARLHATRDPAVEARELGLSQLPESKGELIPEFLSAILEDKDISVHTQGIFDVVGACVGLDTSLRTGSPVEIEYV